MERGRQDVVPALVRLATEHTVDSLGLNAPALHALWTLHGLGALARDSAAMNATRRALHHPAAAVRRAALMMLPRDRALLDGIFAAGILPERASPWPVDYTVGTPILQDADAHVRLEALLVLAEIGGSEREVKALNDVITFPGNARDPWIPDAVAMAGAKLGPEFLSVILAARVPNDSVATAGMRRTVHKLGRIYATDKNLDVVTELISAAPTATPPLGAALINGIAEGWPLDSTAAPPVFSAKQKAALVAAANRATGELAEGLAKVAVRWNAPDAFKPQ